MKNDRQNQLLQIISEEIIETQEQLLERLQAKGIKSTQATISRDIKELHLIKEPAGQGKYRYAVSAHRTKLNFAGERPDGGQRPEYRGHQDSAGSGQCRGICRGRYGRAVSGGVPGRRRHGSADHAGHGKRRGFYGRNQGNAALTARKLRRTAEGYADAAIAPHREYRHH